MAHAKSISSHVTLNINLPFLFVITSLVSKEATKYDFSIAGFSFVKDAAGEDFQHTHTHKQTKKSCHRKLKFDLSLWNFLDEATVATMFFPEVNFPLQHRALERYAWNKVMCVGLSAVPKLLLHLVTAVV